jgi:ParB family transcriptional regulator, chromosome partitioning protein
LENELKIEYIETKRLIPYLNNARTHSEKQISQLAASIREFGFTNPILVDRLNTIIAGHGRLSAANKLEMERVPVLRIEHMSKAQQKAYVLADNQLALNAGWDNDLLKLELAELKEMDFDINLIGFPDLEFSPDLPDEDEEKNMEQKMVITVSFEDRSALEDLFQELNERGFKVKI